MGGSGTALQMIQALKLNMRRPKKKMYGSYKPYENSSVKERAERRIYKYAEASEKHLRKIRERFLRQHRAMFQKKAAVFTGCVIALIVMFYG